MAGYTELIKNFEKIRDFTRDFFIYGFKGRNDYNGVSPRSYDNERRRIESYLSDYIVHHRDYRGKTISISSNTTAKTSNPLFKIWQTKSFTKNDCFLHFVLLDILSSHQDVSVSEITEIISRDYLSQLTINNPLDSMTIRNKLNEYTKLGILEVKKYGKTLYYSLPNNPLNKLNPDTKESLYTALSYYKNIFPTGFIGHTIHDTSYSDFIYKQIFFAQILDEEVLLYLLSAIREKRIVTLTIASTNSIHVTTTTVIPLKILCNTKTGRRYIAVQSVKKKKYSTIRLDFIKDVLYGDVYPNYDDIKTEYECLTQNTFTLTHQRTKKLHTLKMILNIDERTEKYVLERIEREGRQGIVTKLSDNVFEYHIQITDTLEMVPWLRTFIGRIIDIKGSESHIISQFKKDIDSMASLYCN